jgi:hypothetical protein
LKVMETAGRTSPALTSCAVIRGEAHRPLGSLSLTGSSPATEISDACRSRWEVQKALLRAGFECARGLCWERENAGGASACFRHPLVVRVVIDAVAAIGNKYPTW